jgi:ssDNA-binding replication factor A large subunit
MKVNNIEKISELRNQLNNSSNYRRKMRKSIKMGERKSFIQFVQESIKEDHDIMMDMIYFDSI